MYKEDRDKEKEDKEFLRSIEEIRFRMTGMTTRMVDEFVQKLYKNKGEWIEIYDHFPSINAHRMVLEKVLKRMSFEHPQDKIEVDRLNNRLKLTCCQSDGLWNIIRNKYGLEDESKN